VVKITNEDEYSYPLHMTGQAGTLPPEGVDDVVARLRAVVKEITGRDVVEPVKPRIGFLP
jgi:hypothetical protein